MLPFFDLMYRIVSSARLDILTEEHTIFLVGGQVRSEGSREL
jgi:hypothetical protein